MSKQVDTLPKYPFAPLSEGAFYFPTDGDCNYTVEILNAGYKLWASDLLCNDDNVFELSFDRQCEIEDPVFDEAIANTIIHIFGSNVASRGDTSVYYHFCEEGGKGEVRARLYDRWFAHIQKYAPYFEMYNFEVKDPDTDEPYYTSVFIHNNHPDKELILSEFEKAIRP